MYRPIEIIGDTAGWIHDKGMSLWHKTDNIRGTIGQVAMGTGGGLLIVGTCASNPAGWVIGTGAVLFEVGAILTISDLDVWGTAEGVVKPIEQLQKEREQLIDELFGDEGKRVVDKKCSH